MRRGWRRRPPGEFYSGMHACMRSGGGAPRPREGRAGREEMAGRQTASSFLFLSPLFPCTASFGMPLHCPFKRNADWDEFGVAWKISSLPTYLILCIIVKIILSYRNSNGEMPCQAGRKLGGGTAAEAGGARHGFQGLGTQPRCPTVQLAAPSMRWLAAQHCTHVISLPTLQVLL
jgi:hypothetical protein